MSEGLEAYEIVKEECGYAFGQTANGDRVRKNLPIIEKELKEGEKDHELKVEICEYFGLDNLFPYNDNSKIMEKLKETQSHYYDIQFKKSKKEKALDIISEKNVATTMIKQTQSVREYNVFAYDFLQIKRVDEEKYKLSPQPLTPEEYDLLKEVLINEKES